MPVINVDYPESNVIVEDVYADPTPEPELIDPNIDPIVYLYGPPEPALFDELDDTTHDFLADI